MILIRPACTLLAALGLAWPLAAQEPQAQPNAEVLAVLRHVSPNASGALVIPHLKLMSDEIVQCLEGMNKAELLMGSRPLDLFKAQFNLNSGIDDLGAAAILMIEIPGQDPALVVLAPVNNPQEFLAANFTKAQSEGEYRNLAGDIIHARPLEKHVLLAKTKEAAEAAAQVGGGSAATMAAMLGERGTALLRRGEVFLLVDSRGLDLMRKLSGGMSIPGAPAEATIVPSWVWDEARGGAVVFDADPLGLVIHGWLAHAPDAPHAALTAGGESSVKRLEQLPSKPFLFLSAVDAGGLGGAEAMKPIAAMLGMNEVPAWMSAAAGVQLGVYRSPAGIHGGLLNDAVLLVQTSRTNDARIAFRESLNALGGGEVMPGLKRAISWEEGRVLKSGETVDAYEVQLSGTGPEAADALMMNSLLFGNAGCRGFVETIDGAMIITFSQRPVVIDAALKAARDQGPVMSQNPIVKVMRQWMPPAADVESYVNVGALAKMFMQFAEFAKALGMKIEIDWPANVDALEPIGFAMDVQGHAIQTTTIIPASVLSMTFDQAMAVMMQVEPAPPPAEALESEAVTP